MVQGTEGQAYADEWFAGGFTKGGEVEATVRVFKGADYTKEQEKGTFRIEPLHLPNTPDPPKV